MKCISQVRAACLSALYFCVLARLILGPCLSAQQYTFREYGPSDGLTNLGINCLLQDRSGYLWVGTDNGLFRYDGKTFRQFGHAEGLPHAEIRNLAESPQGVLWVATQDGVARRTGNRFETVDTGVKGQYLALDFDGRGVLYLEHSSGLIRGVPGEAKPHQEPQYRFTMLIPGTVSGLYVHDEDIWYRQDGDLWHLKGNTPERIGSQAGLPADRWGSIVLDSLGNLWARSASRVFELPHALGQPEGKAEAKSVAKSAARFIDRSEGVPHALVARLLADSHGRVFVASSSGAVVFDSSKDVEHPPRTYIDPKHGLPADVVAPMLVDRDESLWLGMRGGGLIRRLGHGEWLSWRKQDGLLNDSVWSVLHDRAGRLWVGSNDGLNVFGPDGALAHSWTAHNGFAGDSVFAITPGLAGDVFVGTAPLGITHLSEKGDILKSYGLASGLPAQQVNAIALDRENRLWVAAGGGCYRSLKAVDKAADLQFALTDLPATPSGTFFHDVQMDEHGAIWVTSGAGLFRYEGGHWRVFTERDGLISADVSAMTVGRDEVWVGYRDAVGMARLRMHGEQVEVTNFSKHDGLSSDLIYALVFDHAGSLWATTDNGVDVLDRTGDKTEKKRHWRQYGTEDGLIWDDGNDHALSVDADGSVWIGTARGLSRYTAPSYVISESPSNVVLTNIQGASGEFHAGDRPVLSHAQDSLLLQFSGLNYASETRTHYRYRLVGYKADWTDTRDTSVQYEGLPGGSYVFEVIAAGPNGQWSPTPARFRFSVRPPWWLSWWFIVATVVVVALLARSVWRYRVKTLIVQKVRLELLVIERTAELRESHRQLEEIAYYDSLTSLPNRRMFTEQFRTRLALTRRHGGVFALLLIDLDSFKQINDAHGHDAGDAVLIESAKLLLASVRQSDCVARLGGDEFAILLISPTEPSGVELVCQRIIDSFAAGIPFNDVTLESTCSVGVAVFPANGENQETLYKSADVALYQAKRLGGNCYSQHQSELQL